MKNSHSHAHTRTHTYTHSHIQQVHIRAAQPRNLRGSKGGSRIFPNFLKSKNFFFSKSIFKTQTSGVPDFELRGEPPLRSVRMAQIKQCSSTKYFKYSKSF